MLLSKRNLLVITLSALLVAALIGFAITMRAPAPARQNPSAEPAEQKKPVDESPLNTARSLAKLASTTEEQRLAADIVGIADHEVDLAFASALRRAQLQPPVENSETKELNATIKGLQNNVQTDQQQVDRLTKLLADPHNSGQISLQQQLELAQAQLALHQDQLDDAKQDLVRAGGDPQNVVLVQQQEHEALEHQSGAGASSSQPKPASLEIGSSLLAQFREWRRLRGTREQLLQAAQQASDAAKTLTEKHHALHEGAGEAPQQATSSPNVSAAPAASESEHSAKIAKLHKLSQDSKARAEYDKRIDAEQQLAKLYQQWADIVSAQERDALHGMLRSLLVILLALLALTLVERGLERSYANRNADHRSFGNMRLIFRFVAQVLGLGVILLVLLGVPSQLSTVLALAGAGLTVALKDFIVAFFGWFVIMGRNGIRVGDWVEINGTGGKVLEVGLLRTFLLETGNWSDAGHPTGRKVSFVNSFAIEGHYFNFTTAGQWLWDEMDILIPAGEDHYDLSNSVLKLVTEETQADAKLATQEWQRATRNSAIQSVSATPAIELRPTNLGVNLVVRYIVQAHNRYQVRTRLYQAIIEMMHKRKAPGTAEESATPSVKT